MPERLLVITPLPEQSISWQIPREFAGIMSYNPRHDIQDYLDLANLNGRISQVEYAARLLQTNNRTQHNLEKALGERLAVEKSTIEYYIDENRQLRNKDYPQPVIKRYEMGQKFLEANGSNEVEREKAEIVGIKKVEEILSTGRDLTLVIASPRSRNCHHGQAENPQDEPEDILYHDNFFDVYRKKAGEITMTRYHSTHTNEGFLNALTQIDPNYRQIANGQKVNAAYLLAHPAISQKSVREILENFALDIKAKAVEEHQKAIEACTPLILSYIRTLIESPLDIDKIKLTINAIFNTADAAVEMLEMAKQNAAFAKFQEERNFNINKVQMKRFQSIDEQIQVSGRLTPKPSYHGCPGGQKGFSLTSSLSSFARAIGAQSLVDFAPFANSQSQEWFTCPRCNFEATGPVGNVCPSCHLTKEEYSKETSTVCVV